MKNRLALTLMATLICSTLAMAQLQKLPAPAKTGGKPVMEALWDRASGTEFSDKMLSDQDLSNLLFAAIGVNRPADGKLTSPTARNFQEIRVFVFTSKGVSEYLNKENALKQVAKGDHRGLVADRQDWAKAAPVSILIVADETKFGSSDARAKVTMGNPDKITFANVAGAEEEKQELQEVVEFLRAPKRFIKMGARIPKGVLLVGPPGTGKTLIAKAVAGEANVPFFSISGSDFVEMFVGVGASRVRDLFATAKKCAPAIVFIDEIDAVGRQRGTGLGGGHDEREQTLNQLLVEMDGFVANEGIIVIAATNRADILDPALLRPGRFDRQIVVNYPDVEGREAILKVHAKGKPFADDVDLSVLAKRTPGFTGADLENVLNEAAILAARFSKDKITMDELEEAITRAMMGPEKKSRIITEEDKRITAYHESGHAIVSLKLKGCDPVHEVTIIPRGMANGYTMTLPDRESNHLTKCKLLDEIAMLLGGRAAEEIALPDISAGAYNDLQRASTLARRMVVEFGMSEEIGPVFLGGQTEVFIGKELGHTNNCSENMSAKIDAAIYRIIEEQYNRAKDIISSDMEALERVSNKLIEYERMTGDEFRKIYEGEELELVPYREKMEKREQERKEREESAKKENEPKQRRDADDLEALVRLREADGGIPKDGGSSGQ